ncbi:MAG: TetR/AcrR family transcriptional regulator [Salinisphaera sp.]|nr:TetR/AcrR family transcriptional regulator [Salinisphaera sp.]
MSAVIKQLRLPPEERRAQLVGHAVKVAAAKGLGRIVHADVARAAGVSVPTAFLYFPNRAALLTAVIDEVDRFYMQLARTYHGPDADPSQAVDGHLRDFGESVDRYPDYAVIWLEWATMVRNEFKLWDAFLDFQARITRLVARSIRRCQKLGIIPANISAMDRARLLYASSYSLAQLKLMGSSQQLVNRYTRYSLQMVLQPAADP